MKGWRRRCLEVADPARLVSGVELVAGAGEVSAQLLDHPFELNYDAIRDAAAPKTARGQN